jgi:hypothetical protein
LANRFWQQQRDFFEQTAHSSPPIPPPVALRDGILYVRVLQPALHYELEQISKSEILRKLKQRFGGKTIRDIRFRVG